jgi:hypothetical protein
MSEKTNVVKGNFTKAGNATIPNVVTVLEVVGMVIAFGVSMYKAQEKGSKGE